MIVRTPEVTLEKSAAQYRTDRANPEKVFDLYEAFWDNFRANLVRSGMSLAKSDLRTAGFTDEELRSLWVQRARSGTIGGRDLLVESIPVSVEVLVSRAQQEVPDMPFYLPEVLANEYGLQILGKGLPEMRSWLFEPEEHGVINNHQLASWMSIESSLTPPYNNKTLEEAAELFEGKGRLGQTGSIYIAGSAVTKAVEGKYFDEGSYQRSRLLGTAVWGTWASGDGFSSGSYYRIGLGVGHLHQGMLAANWFKKDAKGFSIGFRSAEPMSKAA